MPVAIPSGMTNKSSRNWLVVLDGQPDAGTAVYLGELDAGIRQGVRKLDNALRFTKLGAQRVVRAYGATAYSMEA